MIELVIAANVAAGAALSTYLGGLIADDVVNQNPDWTAQISMVRAHLAVSEALLRASENETDKAKQQALFVEAKRVAAAADAILRQAPPHSDGKLTGLLKGSRDAVLKFLTVTTRAAAAAARGLGMGMMLLGLGVIGVVLIIAKGSK